MFKVEKYKFIMWLFRLCNIWFGKWRVFWRHAIQFVPSLCHYAGITLHQECIVLATLSAISKWYYMLPSLGEFSSLFPHPSTHGSPRKQLWNASKASNNRRFAALLPRVYSSHTQNALPWWCFARSKTFRDLVVHHKLSRNLRVLRSVHPRNELLPRSYW